MGFGARIFRRSVAVFAVAAVTAAMLQVLASERLVADEPVAAGQATDLGASLAEFIDQQIRQGWTDNEIEASPQAPDEEWVRRIYLDLVGRIPTLAETKGFLEDKNPRKRTLLVDALLENEDYVRHFTTIWTNNSIGRHRSGSAVPAWRSFTARPSQRIVRGTKSLSIS